MLIHWKYAIHKGFLSLEGEEKERISKAITNRIIIAQSLYAAGAMLCFVNTYLSILVIILIQLNYAFAVFSKKGE